MSLHLLIVEDDYHLQNLLVDHFANQFQISPTDSVDEACNLIDQIRFEVAIVDRVLTDGDGLDVIVYLHDIQPSTRVIALSRLGTPQQRVTGLERGADDYLTKPVCLAELTIKLRKQLTCTKNIGPNQTIKTKLLQLNNKTAELTLNDSVVRLRRREAQIFSVLLLRYNQVVTRQTIMATVWNKSDFIPNKTTLDVYIRRLRMRLNGKAGRIVTVKGIGYIYQE